VGRGARVPTTVPHSVRNLAPPGSAADHWRHPKRSASRWQELLPLWGTAPDVHFSKFLIRPFVFQKSRQNKYKKIQRELLLKFWSMFVSQPFRGTDSAYLAGEAQHLRYWGASRGGVVMLGRRKDNTIQVHRGINKCALKKEATTGGRALPIAFGREKALPHRTPKNRW
jgi:hypothetical protein